MKIRIILFIIIVTFGSCAKLIIPKGMTYRFSTDNTGIDSLLKVDGYFISDFMYNNEKKYSVLLLYRDGTVAYPIRDLFSSEDYIINIFVDKQTSKAKNFNTGWGGWGVYKLYGDTVKMEVSLWYDRITRMGSTKASFLIENRNQLRLIDGWYKEDKSSYKFKPYENRIDSTNWLLKKDWFRNAEK